MSYTKTEIRSGTYYDSIFLMQLQHNLASLPDVLDAGVVMATPANCALLAESDLLPPEANGAGTDDLLIVVKAETDTSATNALVKVDELLAQRRSIVESEFSPRSLESAAKSLPEANWVLISVPGKYATGVAKNALELNRHVFLYSDNVSLEDEIALKQTARDKGLLVMGPDCGTAIINGIGLGFANRVRRGKIGLVGASGTGLQAITVTIHNLGAGISQAIGTGGRDLKAEVGAISTHQALDLLARDPSTEVIVLVSKPPEPQVATQLLAAARKTNKPIVVNFLGHPPPAHKLGNLHFATTLQEAAELSVQLSVTSNQSSEIDTRNTDYWSLNTDYWLRGLFSGGTLAFQAVLGLQSMLFPLYTNVPLHESQRLPDSIHSERHTILDLGEDEFTVGRLHPMLDNDLRIRRLRQEAADPDVGLILLDVVLGEGTHPDPAGELAPVIQEIRDLRPVLSTSSGLSSSASPRRSLNSAEELEIIVIIVGTDGDPQGVNVQVEKFENAGAKVFRSVTQAIEHIANSTHRQSLFPGNQSTNQPIPNLQSPISLDILHSSLAAINVGLESFHKSLLEQGAQAVHVDWRPPAGGNEKMMSILAKLQS